jgi:DNA-binding response OmpR family regulator
MDMQPVRIEPTRGERQPTVLVVEDHALTRQAMQSFLTDHGFVVLTASSGREAAPYLDGAAGPIDAAVLDVGLPDMDGVYLCDMLHGLHPTMPVVVCSGAATPGDQVSMSRLGARHFLSKPVDPQELVAALKAALP